MNTQELLNLPVKYIMSTDLITVTEDARLEEVDEIFERSHIHHVPVVDYRMNIKGMISYSDILLLKDWGTRFSLKQSKIKNEILLNTTLAGQFMTRNIVSVAPEITLEKCADIFKENFFHALPVVEGEKLVGIVTTFDMLVTAYRDIPLVR